MKCIERDEPGWTEGKHRKIDFITRWMRLTKITAKDGRPEYSRQTELNLYWNNAVQGAHTNQEKHKPWRENDDQERKYDSTPPEEKVFKKQMPK